MADLRGITRNSNWRPAEQAGRYALAALGIFAFCCIVARAAFQSIVIDEADSFLMFTQGNWPGPVYPSSGNHVLHTLLSRWSVAVFGLSELAVRAPSLLGAALYIGACGSMCRRLSSRLVLQVPLFVALVLNPFVMDYLTAARGYSLALGFLMTAIAVAASAMDTEKNLLAHCAWASACAGLSFSANFSFALVNAAAMAALGVWAARRARSRGVLLACVVPGLVAAGPICGYTLWHWPPGQLFAGARTLREMCHSVVADSFDHLNGLLIVEQYRPWLEDLKAAFVASAVLTVPVMALALEGRRRTFFRFLIAVLGVALLLHWSLFEMAHIPLPKDRTAVFLAPLVTLIFGTALAARNWDRAGVAGWLMLALAGCWFVGCLRLDYFKEWRYNSDSREIYQVVQQVQRRCGVRKIVTAWFYTGSLNFYRARFHQEDQEPYESAAAPLPENGGVYILYRPDSEAFLQKQRLKIVYYSPVTNAVVAMRDCESKAGR